MSGAAETSPLRPSQAVRFVMRGYGGAAARIAATALLGGLVEALFLVTVTRAAFAITDGADKVSLGAGWFLSLTATLGLALALVSLRLALAGYVSWQSADVSTRVVAHIRQRIAQAFQGLRHPRTAGAIERLLPRSACVFGHALIGFTGQRFAR